jgi:hypothetical protein
MEDFLQLEEMHNYGKVAESLQRFVDKVQGQSKKVGES